MRTGPLIALALLLGWSSAALAASEKPKRPAARMVLRGPQPAEPKKAPATAAIQSPIPQSPDAVAPRYGDDPAPRVAGYGASAAGGGQCRLTCAQDRYACATIEDAQDCAVRWSRCVASCPGVTSGSL